MRPIPPDPVFSRADLRALGWSDSAIGRSIRIGRLIRLRRGLLCGHDRLDPQTHAHAAARDICGSVVSHRSALLLHDLPVVGARPPVPEITVVPSGRGSARAALLHRASLPSSDVVEVDGVRVTSVARTLIDIARSRPLSTAVSATDAALHRGLVSFSDLDAVVLRCWNWPGIRCVHRVLDQADGRSESPLESVSRLVIAWLGLPRPDLQPRVLDEYDRPIARLDFYWDDFGVAGEADGRSKYDARPILTAEKERQEQAEDLAVVFTRWGWADTERPLVLRRKIASAFERGAARDRSGLPRRWSISRSKPVTREENLINWPSSATAGQLNACPSASAG